MILTCTVILMCAVKKSEHVQTPRCLSAAIEEEVQLLDSPHRLIQNIMIMSFDFIVKVIKNQIEHQVQYM